MSAYLLFTWTYRWTAGVFSAGALLASLIYARWGWGKTLEQGDPVKKRQAYVLIAWTLLPPIWFWAEFYFLRPAYCVPGTNLWEEFKYGQDLASKIWIAAASALLILYFWKDIRGK